jgi:nicotinate-nucleotide adenylyltransferase
MIQAGLFSGSFNPIHIGHLALSNWLCEYGYLDEIWFVPTPQNPLKDADTLMDSSIRMQMVRAAVNDYPQFKVSDYEYRRPAPTYTIDTLRGIHKDFPDHKFHLIIGADNWSILHRWKDSDKIISEYSIIIYPRKGYEVVIPPERPNIIYADDAPVIEIASASIRQAFRENKDLRFFMPESVYHIYKKYRSKNL